jgi:hypothetical protein
VVKWEREQLASAHARRHACSSSSCLQANQPCRGSRAHLEVDSVAPSAVSLQHPVGAAGRSSSGGGAVDETDGKRVCVAVRLC